MTKTIEMFEKVPRKNRRIIMHMIDAGTGPCVGQNYMAIFQCKKCGHETEWLNCDSPSEIRKGLPCPKCN